MSILDITNLEKYVIEEKDDFKTFLIPGKILKKLFHWFGEERAKAFSEISQFAPSKNDIDNFDEFYDHMILWDNCKNKLIGGQRIRLWSHSDDDFHNSYLRQFHTDLFPKLLKKNHSFGEIGRTFVMPAYQNNGLWLRELIRGFVRIPESRGVNIAIGLVSFNHLNLSKELVKQFIYDLESSLFKGDLEITSPDEEFFPNKDIINISNWDGLHLVDLERILKEIDPNFKLPRVIKPYRALCSVEFQSFSVAHNYNKLMQLLFSGRSEIIGQQQRRRLPPYPNSFVYEDSI